MFFAFVGAGAETARGTRNPLPSSLAREFRVLVGNPDGNPPSTSAAESGVCTTTPPRDWRSKRDKACVAFSLSVSSSTSTRSISRRRRAGVAGEFVAVRIRDS